MKNIFPSYKLTLVREKDNQYEVDNVINNPKDIETIARNVLEIDKNAEEVVCILALNIKNKVKATFRSFTRYCKCKPNKSKRYL